MVLTDKQLKQIPAKEFKQAMGLNKNQYRRLRVLYYLLASGSSLTMWVREDEKRSALDILKDTDIDVIYVTRRQTERE